ncbi:hypothetical protein Tco_1225294, partial [Tanacetum coccineum]
MYETCALRKQSTVRLTVGLSPTTILRREIPFRPWKPVLVSLWPIRHGPRAQSFEAMFVQYVCRCSPINVHAMDVVTRCIYLD